MSDLIDLLSDLALLESSPLDMDQRAKYLIFNIKNQLDDFCSDLAMSANLLAAVRYSNEYSTDPAHYDELGSLSQSSGSNLDSMQVHPIQFNSGLGAAALSKSSESRSGVVDANLLHAKPKENETHNDSRFEIMNGDHMLINALNQGLPTPQLTDTALGGLPAPGPYYFSAGYSSTSSPTLAGPCAVREDTIQNKHVFPGASGRTSGANLVSNSATSNSSAGPSNSNSAIRRNATQMKRALSEASSRIAAGGAQKKAKGDMDPENHEIYRLRQENKQFDEIAEIINNVRSASGKPSNLTGNAIYGRYKRNATLIAAARGEVFKPCELDLQAGTNLKAITQPVPTGFDDSEDRLLVEAYKYVMENTWSLVSKRLEEMTGRVHEPADCANRFAYL